MQQVELGIMGMPIVLDLRDDLDDDVVAAMWDELRRADFLFSTYKDDSEISRLNRGELALQDAHPDVKVYVYPAGHGFNSDRRTDYHEESAKLARQRTLDLFHANGG